MSDDLIPVRKADIVLGKPLPWAVYDASGVLLLNRGVTVTSQHQLDTLTEKGLYRQGHPSQAVPQHGESSMEAFSGAEEHSHELGLEQIRLDPGETIQLQEQEGAGERHNVRFIGFVRGRSVLVSHPVQGDKLIYVHEGQCYLVRAFSGVSVCSFNTRVQKVCLTPYPYLHLTYPHSVRAVRLRKAPRVPVDIVIAIHEEEGGRLMGSGRIVDLSLGGTRIHAPNHFGERDVRVFISFKAKLDGVEQIVTAPAFVRSQREETDDKGRPVKVTGVEFGELTPTQRLVIMNLVYQHLFKEA